MEEEEEVGRQMSWLGQVQRLQYFTGLIIEEWGGIPAPFEGTPPGSEHGRH